MNLLDLSIAHVHHHIRSFLLDRDLLVAHASGKVERLDHFSPQGELLCILRHALLDDLADLCRHLEVAVCGRGVVDPLMGALEVVMAFDPEAESLAQIVDRSGHDTAQELFLQVLPERLYLSQGLGMVGSRDDVVDPFAEEFLLEDALAAPGVVLTALIAEDFLGRAVLADRGSQDLHHLKRSLRGIEAPAHDVPRVVVHEGDQIDLLALGHGPHRDVGLPELVGFRPLEAPHHFGALPFPRFLGNELRLFQGLGDLVLGDGQELRPAQPLSDAGDAEPAEGLLRLEDGLGNLFLDRRQFTRGFATFLLESRLSFRPVEACPRKDSRSSDPIHLRQFRGCCLLRHVRLRHLQFQFQRGVPPALLGIGLLPRACHTVSFLCPVGTSGGRRVSRDYPAFIANRAARCASIAYLAYRSSEKAKAEVSTPPPVIAKEPANPEPPKEPEKPVSVASVLRLRQGTYLAGLISYSGDFYTVLANGETVKVNTPDVDRWFRSSREMASDAGNASQESQQLYARAQETKDGRSANAFLRQAVDKAEAAHDGYLLTRQYFASPVDRWLDDSLVKAKELLKLVREAELASRIKGTPTKPPSDPDKETPRRSPTDDGGKKALEKAIGAALEGILSGEASVSAAQRRAVRDKLLLSVGPASRALHAALLIYLSRSDHDWGTRFDELTLTSSTIQYKHMPGRILQKSPLDVEFELAQGGVVMIRQSGDSVRFTPPGGENQSASEFSIKENLPTPQAQALMVYFKALQDRVANLDAKAHVELIRILRIAVADVTTLPAAGSLFIAAHANELLSSGLSDKDRSDVDVACRAIGFLSSPTLDIRGTQTALELADYYESMASPGSTPAKSPGPGSVQLQLLTGYGLIQKAVGSGLYKDFLAAQTSLESSATSARRTAFRDLFLALSSAVRQAAPCKTCNGKHTLAILCRECKGAMRRDYTCGACSGHGYVMVLGGAGLVNQTCKSCNGQGVFRDQPCKLCKAAGALDCKDCKAPWRPATMTDVAGVAHCGMCGGQGLLFRNPIIECPDCYGLGVCLTPTGSPTKIVCRPLRERDGAELVKARGRRLAMAVVTPFDGKDLSVCDFPIPAKKACWSANQGRLVCENLDAQNDAMIQFAKVKGSELCSLSLSFTLPAEYFNLKGSMAVELTAAGGLPRWVVVINNAGGMNIQKFDGESNKWLWIVPSQGVMKQAELANWNRLEVSNDDGKLSVLLNGEVVMTANLDQSIQGGYIGLRGRGGVHSFKDLQFRTGAK